MPASPSSSEPGGGPRPPGAGFTLFLPAAAALGAALSVLLRQGAWGGWLGLDSLYYLETARNLAAGEGFTHFDGTLYTLMWPPLYPLLLAVLGLGLFDPAEIAGPLGAAAFGGSVFVVGRILGRRLRSRFFAVWAVLSAALAAPLAAQAAWAMTDLLLILFSLLALAETESFLAGGRRSGALVRAAVFSGLAWASRLVGAAVPGAVGLLLLFSGGAPFRQRLRHTLAFSVIAAAPMGLWFLRHSLAFDWTGNESRAAHRPLAALLGELGSGLLDWARPARLEGVPGGAGPLLALAGLAGAALLPLAAAALRDRWGQRAGGRRSDRRSSPGRPATVFGVFALGYLALLVATVAAIDLRGLPPRYLLPLFLPLLVVVAATLDRLLADERGREAARSPEPRSGRRRFGEGIGGALFAPGRRRARTAALLSGAALLLWTAGQGAANVEGIRRARAGEIYLGYSGPAWARSELLAHLRENPLRGPVFSNEPVILAFHGVGGGDYRDRGYPWSCLPTWRPRRAPPVEERLRDWLEEAPDGAFVVSFHGRWSPPCEYGAPALRLVPGLRAVAELEDGAVYRVDRSLPPRPDPYRSAAAAARAGDFGPPLVRSRFEIYDRGDSLLYLRAPCAAPDTAPDFALRVFPAAPADLPAASREQGYEDRGFEDREFEDRGFPFREHGMRLDGECAAIVPLPPYPIARLTTGQRSPDPAVRWQATARLDFDRFRAERERILAGARGEPVVRSHFDLYLDGGTDGRTLAYHRAPCGEEEVAPRFLLHLRPRDPADLPAGASPGFENRDFDFAEHGMILDGECLALVPLPAHELASVTTGQWRPGEPPFWRAVLRPDRDRYADALAALASGSAGAPAARSTFDLYFRDGALLYHRAPCAEEDLEARFFLHLFPAAPADLPGERREHGFENRDFDFGEHGARQGGECLALVALPDYPLAGLRTGQYRPGEGEAWGAEVTLPPPAGVPSR